MNREKDIINKIEDKLRDWSGWSLNTEKK
jgi:hypothetical protein